MLTEGGARVWAICFSCEERGGRTLRRAWLTVIGWIALPILGLALLVMLLGLLTAK